MTLAHTRLERKRVEEIFWMPYDGRIAEPLYVEESTGLTTTGERWLCRSQLPLFATRGFRLRKHF